MSVDLSLDHTLASLVYAGTNELSWLKSILLPGVQALANIKILEKQQDQYEDIANDKIRILDLALSRYNTRLEQILPEFANAYPDVPQAAEYVPVDPCAEQGYQLECNIGHTPKANEWARTVNRFHAQSDFTRIVVLDPRWYVNMEMYSLTLGNLLRGELPLSDLMEVTTDAAETNILTGRVGRSKSARRNVALKRVRVQASGLEELRRQAGLFERLSPVNRQASPHEMMQTPQQRLALALTQAQLIQNSLQNVFNRNAQKPPHRLATLNLQLEMAINRMQVEASKANLVNTFVPNYAAILQPQINALTSTVAGAMEAPNTNQSTYNAPSVGGDYLKQNGVNPFSDYTQEISSGKVVTEK